ncbi:MAG TPA: DUF433 domain-containing protein [Calditrichia bacterium]|nr:DUF433 domain-containing protein [Calditrichia bacterium]
MKKQTATYVYKKGVAIKQTTTGTHSRPVTRLTVELLVELLAEGASLEDLQRQYPQLTQEMIRRALKSYFSIPRSDATPGNGRVKKIKR